MCWFRFVDLKYELVVWNIFDFLWLLAISKVDVNFILARTPCTLCTHSAVFVSLVNFKVTLLKVWWSQICRLTFYKKRGKWHSCTGPGIWKFNQINFNYQRPTRYLNNQHFHRMTKCTKQLCITLPSQECLMVVVWYHSHEKRNFN